MPTDPGCHRERVWAKRRENTYSIWRGNRLVTHPRAVWDQKEKCHFRKKVKREHRSESEKAFNRI